MKSGFSNKLMMIKLETNYIILNSKREFENLLFIQLNFRRCLEEGEGVTCVVYVFVSDEIVLEEIDFKSVGKTVPDLVEEHSQTGEELVTSFFPIC